jgi:hypothetical protein
LLNSLHKCSEYLRTSSTFEPDLEDPSHQRYFDFTTALEDRAGEDGMPVRSPKRKLFDDDEGEEIEDVEEEEDPIEEVEDEVTQLDEQEQQDDDEDDDDDDQDILDDDQDTVAERDDDDQSESEQAATPIDEEVVEFSDADDDSSTTNSLRKRKAAQSIDGDQEPDVSNKRRRRA